MFSRSIGRKMTGAMVVLLCGLLMQPGAQGQNGRSAEEEQSREEEQETSINRREASEIARDAYGGRVLSIRMERGEWRIRIDNEGTVFDVYVNATTGHVRRP